MARRIFQATRRMLIAGAAAALCAGHMTAFAAATPPPPHRKLDELFESRNYAAIVDSSGSSADNDDEVLWRLARACRFLAQDKSLPPAERKVFAERCLAYATRAVEINPDNWAAQKWLGIAYNVAGEFQSTKEQLQNAFKIRACFDRALELNPRDATTAHLIGVWCTYFASITFVTRSIASLLFASPPSSTYDEALRYLLLAEDLEPGFYKTNAWQIAKIYYAQGDKVKFAQWKANAEKLPSKDVDDERATAEMKTWR